MSYLKLTAKGLGWVGGGRVFSRAFAYARIAVLARVLTPADFGAIGVATLILAFLEILTETGINTVLIQKKQSIDSYINTAWIISIARGLVIFILLVLLAPVIAHFFRSPESKNLILLISLVPLIRGFINPSIVKFHRNLRFDKEVVFRNGLFVVDALVAIILAIVTRRPESLIVGFIVSALLEVFFSHMIVKPYPKFKFSREKARYITDHGKWLTGQGILQYAFRQGDDIIVGRVLGITSLGYYQQAYKISTLPISEIADVVGKVTFPVFTKFSDNKARLKRAFSKSFFSVSVLSAIIGGIIYLFPEEIISLILGDKWLPVVSVLKILAIFGVLKAISSSFNPLFLSLKKQRYVIQTAFVGTVFMLLSIVPLISLFGLNGAAYATIIGVLASMPLTIYYYLKVFRTNT